MRNSFPVRYDYRLDPPEDRRSDAEAYGEDEADPSPVEYNEEEVDLWDEMTVEERAAAIAEYKRERGIA